MTLSNDTGTNAKHKKRGVRIAYTWHDVQTVITVLRQQKKSFRKIAEEDFNSQITHATIQRIASGKEPKSPKIRAILGLPNYKHVTPIIGEIPEGSQSIGAVQCICGQWFITNHPRRTKCFVCSPFKGKSRQ